jgi:hypothetical protein
MPNYTVDTSFLNQPTPKQQTLGDLINMASGIQNYQQAQQLNPVQLENAQNVLQQNQLALEKTKQINPLEIAKTKLELEKRQALQPSEIEAGKAKSEGEIYEVKQKYATPLNDAVTSMLQSKAMQTNDVDGFIAHVADQRDRLIDQGMPRHIAEKQFAKIINAAQDPKEGLPYIKQTLENTQKAQIGAVNRQGLITPQVVEINRVKYFVNPTTMQLMPVGQEQTAPTKQETAPTAPIAPTAPQGQAPKLVQEDPQMSIPQNVKIPQMNEQQQTAYSNGKTLKSTSADAALEATKMAQTIRKVEQFADKAAGSKPGQLLRNGKKWIYGDEDYDGLLKNIADMQIKASNIAGVKSDAGAALSNTASGSDNISEKALRDILERAKADVALATKFDSGLQKYIAKRGEYNGHINVERFKDAWRNNYDPLLLMIQNVNTANLTKEQKEKKKAEIMSNLTDDQLVEFRKKQENLKRLEKGDYQ